MRLSIAFAAALVLFIAGCDYIRDRYESPPPYDQVDRPPPGPPGQCRAACNSDQSRCFDASAARRDTANPFFGAGAVCDRELQRCLQRCAGRP